MSDNETTANGLPVRKKGASLVHQDVDGNNFTHKPAAPSSTATTQDLTKMSSGLRK